MVILARGADVDKVRQGADDFTACMRDNGLKGLPAFKVTQAGKDGVRLELSGSGKALDPHADAYKKAFKACAPNMEKAGVPLPEGPEPSARPANPDKARNGRRTGLISRRCGQPGPLDASPRPRTPGHAEGRPTGPPFA